MAAIDKSSPPKWFVFDEMVDPETGRRSDKPGVEKVFQVHVVRLGGNEPDHSLSEDCWCDPAVQKYDGGNKVIKHRELQ